MLRFWDPLSSRNSYFLPLFLAKIRHLHLMRRNRVFNCRFLANLFFSALISLDRLRTLWDSHRFLLNLEKQKKARNWIYPKFFQTLSRLMKFVNWFFFSNQNCNCKELFYPFAVFFVQYHVFYKLFVFCSLSFSETLKSGMSRYKNSHITHFPLVHSFSLN